MNPSTGVIIPSAGKGSRMQSGLPKQFHQIGGMSVLGHTILRLLSVGAVRHLVIPASAEFSAGVLEIASDCIEKAGKTGDVVLDVIQGGTERMHSVEKSLDRLMDTDTGIVLVHDAVRPCFPVEPVRKAIDIAISEGAAILAIPSRDTVKLVDGRRRIISTPDRGKIWLAQTPQVFRKEILKDACEKAKAHGFVATDDASLAEYAGYPVHVVESSQDNIKITYSSDLDFAERWLKANSGI